MIDNRLQYPWQADADWLRPDFLRDWAKAEHRFLDLDRAGLRTDDKGSVIVNYEMQTSAPNIWPSGDVIGEPMLESIAAKKALSPFTMH